MPTCKSCNAKGRVDKIGICKACKEADKSLPPITEGLEEEFENLPDLPDNWFTEPIQNLNGGHILKILLLGNNKQKVEIDQLNNRVLELENHTHVQNPKVTANTEHSTANGAKIEELEKTVATLKKVIVNQQEYMEQLQRNNLAKNAMITGIPNGPLVLNGNPVNDPEEKVKAIVNELNPDLNDQDYSVRMFDPFTKHDGTVTLSAKITFQSINKKKETLINSKTRIRETSSSPCTSRMTKQRWQEARTTDFGRKLKNCVSSTQRRQSRSKKEY